MEIHQNAKSSALFEEEIIDHFIFFFYISVF